MEQPKNKFEGVTMSKWKILYNDGAIERKRTPNDEYTIEGTEEDLMESLQSMYIDCVDEYWNQNMTLEDWLNYYEEWADLGGSTALLMIRKDSNIIYQAVWCDEFENGE